MESSRFFPFSLSLLELSHACVHAKLLQSCLTFCDPVDCIACQAPLSMGFSRQEYWSGLPCPPPGDLPDPEIKPMSLTFPALAGRFFTTSATWEDSQSVSRPPNSTAFFSSLPLTNMSKTFNIVFPKTATFFSFCSCYLFVVSSNQLNYVITMAHKASINMFGKNNSHLINIIQLMGKEEHDVFMVRSTDQGAQSEQREQGDG